MSSLNAEVNFDNGKGVNIQEEINKPETKTSQTLPKKSISSKEYNNENKGRVVIMKDMLRKMSLKDKSTFINSMTIKNGHIVSFNYGVLEKYFNNSDVERIVSDLFFKKTDKFLPTDKENRYCSVSEILTDIPTKNKIEFFESIIIKNGLIVSVSIEPIVDALDKDEIFGILNKLSPTPNLPPTSGSKILCGDGWCKDLTCIWTDGDREWKCGERKKHICYTSCYDN